MFNHQIWGYLSDKPGAVFFTNLKKQYSWRHQCRCISTCLYHDASVVARALPNDGGTKGILEGAIVPTRLENKQYVVPHCLLKISLNIYMCAHNKYTCVCVFYHRLSWAVMYLYVCYLTLH